MPHNEKNMKSWAFPVSAEKPQFICSFQKRYHTPFARVKSHKEAHFYLWTRRWRVVYACGARCIDTLRHYCLMHQSSNEACWAHQKGDAMLSFVYQPCLEVTFYFIGEIRFSLWLLGPEEDPVWQYATDGEIQKRNDKRPFGYGPVLEDSSSSLHLIYRCKLSKGLKSTKCVQFLWSLQPFLLPGKIISGNPSRLLSPPSGKRHSMFFYVLDWQQLQKRFSKAVASLAVHVRKVRYHTKLLRKHKTLDCEHFRPNSKINTHICMKVLISQPKK